MTTIWILTAQLMGGWAMLPFDSEAACQAALAALPASVTQNGECTRIQTFALSSPLAPEMAPMPKRKPVRSTP